jgi:hypothetical protein
MYIGTPYTWEAIDQVTANFTPDMTPLVLAGKQTTLILKILWMCRDFIL